MEPASSSSFTEEDLIQLEKQGIGREQACYQLELLIAGVRPPQLLRPCTVGDGIVRLTDAEVDRYGKKCGEGNGELIAAKFVPASGAATRMLRALTWVDANCKEICGSELVELAKREGGYYREFMDFAHGLPRLACFVDLKRVMGRDGLDTEGLWEKGEFKTLLSYLLGDHGLGYASLPKALIKFHRYNGETRTALEEHLTEAAVYVRDKQGRCRVHFTVAARHRQRFDSYLAAVRGLYELSCKVQFAVQLSVQAPSTDTIALEEDGRLARNADGSLLLRPGGHGALLGNLEETRADVVFINNVDDVMHEAKRSQAYRYKTALGGVLLELRREIFELFQQFETGGSQETAGVPRARYICQRLGRSLPEGFERWDRMRQGSVLRELLNRPLRVCGVVANRGEAGGGPFWVKGRQGDVSLQIIEQAQVDSDSDEQMSVFRSATHFNPVHIVCLLTGYGGERFPLSSFADPSQAFVTFKSDGERKVKALELPGLWNGGMALWNTLFVEIPREAFAPTKTICDLLKPAHQGQ